MNGSGIGELGVGEADAFEIREVLAELPQTFIVDGAAAMADFDEPRPAFKLGIGVAFHAGADKGKCFEALQSRKMLQSDIGQLAVVGESQRFQVCKLAQRRDPLIAEFGRDNVERLQRLDVTEMLKEGGSIGIDLTRVMRSRVGHGQVHELQRVEECDVATGGLLQAFGCGVDLLDPAGRGLDGPHDGCNVCVSFNGGEQGVGVILECLFQVCVSGRRDNGFEIALGFDIGERGGRLGRECRSQSAEG